MAAVFFAVFWFITWFATFIHFANKTSTLERQLYDARQMVDKLRKQRAEEADWRWDERSSFGEAISRVTAEEWSGVAGDFNAIQRLIDYKRGISPRNPWI